MSRVIDRSPNGHGADRKTRHPVRREPYGNAPRRDRLIHAQPLRLAKAQKALGGGAPDGAQAHLLGHLVAHLRDAAA
jgi:hypothetical protein